LTTKSLGLDITKTVIVVGLILVILLSSSILASAASNKSATAKTQLDIYSDSSCTKKISSIDWGTLTAGGSITKTVYLKNSGTTPLTLSLAKTNWSPSTISSSISCVWNRQNTVLAPNKITSATLTLTTAANFSIRTSFSLNIVITGTA
jgi:hypothetical protein